MHCAAGHRDEVLYNKPIHLTDALKRYVLIERSLPGLHRALYGMTTQGTLRVMGCTMWNHVGISSPTHSGSPHISLLRCYHESIPHAWGAS